ncbi:MAG: hypothetical protein MSG64_18420 [Pyrinomonadaceae bacterium MAG19_C2-C3]|nr:hypothetical protein [Pyrinomonadaceae bacterium MAG19_C2-C3]
MCINQQHKRGHDFIDAEVVWRFYFSHRRKRKSQGDMATANVLPCCASLFIIGASISHHEASAGRPCYNIPKRYQAGRIDRRRESTIKSHDCVHEPKGTENSCVDFSLVHKFGDERRPSGIIDTLGEHPACESFNIQIFNRDNSEVINQPTTDFVVKVGSLIVDVRVRSLQELHGKTSALSSLFASCNFALCFAELLLCLRVVARILYFRSIRQGSKRGQSNVNADGVGTRGQSFSLRQDGETGEPTPGFALNRERLNLPFYATLLWFISNFAA